jgi:hypothetical protein
VGEDLKLAEQLCSTVIDNAMFWGMMYICVHWMIGRGVLFLAAMAIDMGFMRRHGE